MSDVFTTEKRSSIMATVKSRNTRPEMQVRRILHRLGYRFRLHYKGLPGKPDIVLPRHQKIVFVHGCFWHGHQDCKRSARPTSNVEFWNRKIDGNMRRDEEAYRQLMDQGWKVLVVWQCETKDIDELRNRFRQFMTT